MAIVLKYLTLMKNIFRSIKEMANRKVSGFQYISVSAWYKKPLAKLLVIFHDFIILAAGFISLFICLFIYLLIYLHYFKSIQSMEVCHGDALTPYCLAGRY